MVNLVFERNIYFVKWAHLNDALVYVFICKKWFNCFSAVRNFAQYNNGSDSVHIVYKEKTSFDQDGTNYIRKDNIYQSIRLDDVPKGVASSEKKNSKEDSKKKATSKQSSSLEKMSLPKDPEVSLSHPFLLANTHTLLKLRSLYILRSTNPARNYYAMTITLVHLAGWHFVAEKYLVNPFASRLDPYPTYGANVQHIVAFKNLNDRGWVYGLFLTYAFFFN